MTTATSQLCQVLLWMLREATTNSGNPIPRNGTVVCHVSAGLIRAFLEDCEVPIPPELEAPQ